MERTSTRQHKTQDEDKTEMTTRKISAKVVTLAWAAVLLAVLTVAPVKAQDVHPGWQPYIGCWEPISAGEAEGTLCFVPDAQHVEMLTVISGELAYREPFSADGSARAIEQDGCQGTETAVFSADQRRIYTSSDVACEGGTSRHSDGIISMPYPGQWLDVRMVEVDGRATTWSQWYQKSDDAPLARLLGESVELPGGMMRARGFTAYATAPITVDEVIDASQNVDHEAVRAWIAEAGQEFRGLDTKDILALTDAGVSEAVIDVVVAISFPEHFNVGGRSAQVADNGGQRRVIRTVWAGYSPYGSYGYGYSPYYYGSNYYGGYYGGWGWGRSRPYTPGNYTVTRTTTSRAVSGKGYTQGNRPDQSAGGVYRPSGSGRSSIGSSGSDRRSSPPSRSTGRKAKPKGKK